MLSNLSNPLAFGVVGVESSMAHTRQRRVEQFYRESKDQILASARRLDRDCAEDLIQEVLAIWLRPTQNPQFTVMAFVRQMELLVHRDTYQRSRVKGVKGEFATEKRPTEVHGDVDRLWRARHGRRTPTKGGAE